MYNHTLERTRETMARLVTVGGRAVQRERYALPGMARRDS